MEEQLQRTAGTLNDHLICNPGQSSYGQLVTARAHTGLASTHWWTARHAKVQLLNQQMSDALKTPMCNTCAFAKKRPCKTSSWLWLCTPPSKQLDKSHCLCLRLPL